jgi:predicted NAD/FAD-dependent oxidoreductase
LTAARPWLGDAQILESQPKKWRFATPRTTWPEPFWIEPSCTLALAGDAFAGPKMEGAALSGLAAARALTN